MNESPRIETFRANLPEGVPSSAPTVVLLHGRGSHEGDLIELHPHLGAGIRLYAPRAPFPAADWGYGPGWAWYRYIQDDQMVPETLEASLRALDTFLDSLPPSEGPLYLGGFSQGGTTALAWALTRPGRLEGVINLSGFLAGIPPVQSALTHASGLRVFWGHGALDPAIPFALGTRGRSALLAAGAELTPFDHPGGHNITGGELESLRAFLAGSEADNPGQRVR